MSAPQRPEAAAGVLPLTPGREARLRAAVVAAARSWIGTPYRQLGFTKGPAGAVDCSMLLVAAYVEAGVYPPFDPRPYPANWYLHHGEERYLGWLTTVAREVEVAQPGDIVCWLFGRCFSHSAILVDAATVVHALAWARTCCLTPRDHPRLRWADRAGTVPRPVRIFDVFARLRDGGAEAGPGAPADAAPDAGPAVSLREGGA